MSKLKKVLQSQWDEPESASKHLLKMAQLHAEKCELRQARLTYEGVLQQAKRDRDSKSMMEALAGLLRLAGEALDEAAMKK